MKPKILLTLVLNMVLIVLIQGEVRSRNTGDVATFDLAGDATIEMVWIEPGTFMMGSPPSEPGRYPDEGPQHQVTIIRGFWLGRYELTQGQWESVMGTRPWSGQDYVQESANNPAQYISRNDMEDFIAKLNPAEGSEVYRLPTEAEWEYACRAGTTTRWSFGDDESQLTNYAWYEANAWNVGEPYGHAVGTKLPNAWGLYDMHGNVWEWCWDWYGSYSSGAQVDPMGPSSGSGRVLRSSFFNGYVRGTRSAVRAYSHASDTHSPPVGARLVRVEIETPVTPSTWDQVKSLLK
jgi:formylglycine-generating enzyme required for sulfatase activity